MAMVLPKYFIMALVVASSGIVPGYIDEQFLILKERQRRGLSVDASGCRV